MVKTPPNHNSLKVYSLQQINNGDNRRLSIYCTKSKEKKERKRKKKKQGREEKAVGVGVGGGGGGGMNPHLSL